MRTRAFVIPVCVRCGQGAAGELEVVNSMFEEPVAGYPVCRDDDCFIYVLDLHPKQALRLKITAPDQ